jgi:hypothetical protein
MASKSDLHDFSVVLHAETDAAWKVSDDGVAKNAVWIPKSQGEIDKSGKVCVLTIPEWLAIEKGLV